MDGASANQRGHGTERQEQKVNKEGQAGSLQAASVHPPSSGRGGHNLTFTLKTIGEENFPG